jgi:microcystin-dependent protein
MDPFISMMIVFGCNFAPRGWAQCNGQLLPIAQNTALFSLLGTTYGGNGSTSFGLPDLRGRVPLHLGQGPGLSNYAQGQMGGTESVTILTSNMPAHTHALSVAVTQGGKAGPGSTDSPVGNIPAGSATDENYAAPAAATGNMAPLAVTATAAPAGNNLPISIVQPYVVLNWCIAIEGIYPSRS